MARLGVVLWRLTKSFKCNMRGMCLTFQNLPGHKELLLPSTKQLQRAISLFRNTSVLHTGEWDFPQVSETEISSSKARQRSACFNLQTECKSNIRLRR